MCHDKLLFLPLFVFCKPFSLPYCTAFSLQSNQARTPENVNIVCRKYEHRKRECYFILFYTFTHTTDRSYSVQLEATADRDERDPFTSRRLR